MERLMFLAYILSTITGSYIAVSSVRALFAEARELERLSNPHDHKMLVFDDIEPAGGHSK